MKDRLVSLDGLRAVAVVAVIFYHHSLFNAGWAGVDLFFVLSGFLITSILRKTRDDPFFWREFWMKRVTRIFPPLILMLVGVWVVDHSFGRYIPGYLLSLGDVLAYLRPEYEKAGPLWSLAVEEHFYLLWPFAVRFLNRRSLVTILFVLILAEPILRYFVVIARPDWEFIYFLTPFRLDGISMGALLALALESPVARAKLQRFSIPGMLVSAALYAGFHHIYGIQFTRGVFPVYNAFAYSIVPCVAFFLIARLVTAPHGITSRALSWKPLTFLGSISYGLYLFHTVIRDVAMSVTGLSMRHVIPLSSSVTVVLAYLSFRFYEKPLILYGKRTAQRLHNTTSLAKEEISVRSAP